MTKFELSISTSYVPDWGIVEAFRELFQNALDNETVNPDNKMHWEYVDNTVRIGNKTSKLATESLLLGNGTKHTDDRTIGKHGEGYKIAFMVLLRNNKTITVYNYGAREIWHVRLVNSRKYKMEIPVVLVEKQAVWKSVPNNDLVIEVGNISEEEYSQIKESNLHLRDIEINKYTTHNYGSILLDKAEAGKVYVKGLFVMKTNLEYGYDLSPTKISLDRDRRMVNHFDLVWLTSNIWSKASELDDEIRQLTVRLLDNKSEDVKYLTNTINTHTNKPKVYDDIANKFFEEHGDNAIPVVSNVEYNEVIESNKGVPIIVDSYKADIIKQSTVVEKHIVVEFKTVKEKLKDFISKIEHKLNDEELEELERLVNNVAN